MSQELRTPVRRRKKRYSVQVDAKLFARLEWLREDEGGLERSTTGPLSIYIDGETIVEEIRDLKVLRKGDHCLVGLNAARRMSPWFDWICWRLAQWDVLRLYHHFVMVDDVAAINKEGSLPLAANGEPAMLCEFSNTPARAARIFWHQTCNMKLLEGMGSATWLLMAPFQKLPLGDYTSTAGIKGIFRVRQNPPLTDEQREMICADAEKLLHSYGPYNLLWRNCESAAFALSPHSRRWVSPEVPMALWNVFRFGLTAIGALCIRQIPSASPSRARWLTFLFHSFVTSPTTLQSLIELVRAAVKLTERRRDLGERSFHHLLSKEVGRTAVVSYWLGNLLGGMPLWVRRGAMGLKLATFLTLSAFTMCNMAYSILSRGVMKLFITVCGGVPIITFFDANDYDEEDEEDEETPVATPESIPPPTPTYRARAGSASESPL